MQAEARIRTCSDIIAIPPVRTGVWWVPDYGTGCEVQAASAAAHTPAEAPLPLGNGIEDPPPDRSDGFVRVRMPPQAHNLSIVAG